MGACLNVKVRESGGCGTAIRTESAGENRPSLRTGTKRRNASGNVYRPVTITRCRRCAAGRISHLASGIFSGEFFQAPSRARNTHEVNQRALKHLRPMFDRAKLADITADEIELYLRRRLKQRVIYKTKAGLVEKGVLKATTVHQELRAMRRMLNVAVRKKLLSLILAQALNSRRGWAACSGPIT